MEDLTVGIVGYVCVNFNGTVQILYSTVSVGPVSPCRARIVRKHGIMSVMLGDCSQGWWPEKVAVPVRAHITDTRVVLRTIIHGWLFT